MKIKGVSRIVAAVVLAGAICAVFFWKHQPKQEEVAEPVRPIKSMVVGAQARKAVMYYPGLLNSVQSADLAFEVGGRLVDLPVIKGQDVKKGDLIGKLDPSDFDNQVKNAKAAMEYAKSSFERMERALEGNAVSREEYARAKASLDQAEAQLAIAKKARKDVELRAKFAGRVATTYVDNFETVSAGQPVVRLHDPNAMTLEVSVPESMVLTGQRAGDRLFEAVATFDSLPGVELPVSFSEFSSAADPVTQTYKATFVLDELPDEVTLIPGMTATLVLRPQGAAEAALPGEGAPAAAGAGALAVPSDAIGRNSAGEPFVWRLDAAKDGTPGVYETHAVVVAIDDRTGEDVAVTAGLAVGDRIALAGISVLSEGRKVRLLEESPDAIQVQDDAPAEAPAEPPAPPEPAAPEADAEISEEAAQ